MRLGSCELGNHICGDVQPASPTEHSVLTQEAEVTQGQTKEGGCNIRGQRAPDDKSGELRNLGRMTKRSK